MMRPLRTTMFCAMLGASMPVTLLSQEATQPKVSAEKPKEPAPFRVDDALSTPDWLRISGELRLREEWIGGQYRAATTLDHSDLVLMTRAIVRADLDFDRIDARIELLDARAIGAGTGSVVNDTIAAPLDILEAFVAFDLGELADGKHRLRVGRETIDLGKRRLIARNRYRNTINAFDAIDWQWSVGKAQSLRAFWSLPVKRIPGDGSSLLDNEVRLDENDPDRQFYGIYWTKQIAEATDLDVYLFGLDERGQSVRRRSLFTPGVRLAKKPSRGGTDYEVEVSLQFGESQASATGPLLDHLAWFTHASVGHTFDARWSPRVAFAIDYASGDADSADGDNGRFDTLFGARRFEFGPTGLWGSIARSNLQSAELRLEVKPSVDLKAFTALRTIWLAAEKDTWTTAGVRDASGVADAHVGEQLEVAFDYTVVQQSLNLVFGGAYLWAGDFQEQAPNGRGRDSAYAFAEMTFSF